VEQPNSMVSGQGPGFAHNEAQVRAVLTLTTNYSFNIFKCGFRREVSIFIDVVGYFQYRELHFYLSLLVSYWYLNVFIFIKSLDFLSKPAIITV